MYVYVAALYELICEVNPSAVAVAVPKDAFTAAAFDTVKVITKSLVALLASVAVNVTVVVPLLVGVPDIVDPESESPAGNVPDVIA